MSQLTTRSVCASSTLHPPVSIVQVDWAALGVDVALECSGKFLTRAKLQPFFDKVGAQCKAAGEHGAYGQVLATCSQLLAAASAVLLGTVWQPHRHSLLCAAPTRCSRPSAGLQEGGRVGPREGSAACAEHCVRREPRKEGTLAAAMPLNT